MRVSRTDRDCGGGGQTHGQTRSAPAPSAAPPGNLARLRVGTSRSAGSDWEDSCGVHGLSENGASWGYVCLQKKKRNPISGLRKSKDIMFCKVKIYHANSSLS